MSAEEGASGQSMVILMVGGVPYALQESALTKFPDSFFATLLKPEWRSSKSNEAIVIERNGLLFQYIYDFLRHGKLPRDMYGKITLDESTRAALKEEADFYLMRELVAQCTAEDEQCGLAPVMPAYNAIRSTIHCSKEPSASKWKVPKNIVKLNNDEDEHFSEEDSCEEDQPKKKKEKREEAKGGIESIEQGNDHDEYEEMEDDEDYGNKRACVGAVRKGYSKFSQLLRDVTAPFCITGKLSSVYESNTVYKSSNMVKLNMEELLAEATLSPFGKGFETVVDTEVRHSYEIDLSKEKAYGCGPNSWTMDLSKLVEAEDSKLEIRPYKLVIYKQGGHFHAHRDTVRGKNHIGTLVIILNSEYTGGELEVAHGSRTETVTGVYNWVAMYGDCLHKIHPVTSGTRVSLIYDLYRSPKTQYEKDQSMWRASYWNQLPICSVPRDVDEAQRQAVVAGMHQQLSGVDCAMICLQHLYPACQANPNFLKGGDQLLYDILQSHFELAVLPCTIYRKVIDLNMARNYTLKDAVFCIKPLHMGDIPAERCHAQLSNEAVRLKTNFIMVGYLARDHVLEREDIDYTGNDAQGEETVYMVAGLQVRRKSK